MNIYLVRHGQSESNVSLTFTGQLDSKLSKLGKLQSQMVYNFFKDIDVDEIYSSDLSRAVDTVILVAKQKDLKIIKDKRLREIFGGEWENKTFDEIAKTSKEYRDKWKTALFDATCDGGESIKEVCERSVTAFCEIVKKSKSNNVIIASHATPIRAILSFVKFNTLSRIADVSWTVNAGITKNNHFFVIFA